MRATVSRQTIVARPMFPQGGVGRTQAPAQRPKGAGAFAARAFGNRSPGIRRQIQKRRSVGRRSLRESRLWSIAENLDVDIGLFAGRIALLADLHVHLILADGLLLDDAAMLVLVLDDEEAVGGKCRAWQSQGRAPAVRAYFSFMGFLRVRKAGSSRKPAKTR